MSIMEYKTLEFKQAANSETGFEFEGYASTSDLDRGNDIVAAGAFTKSLQKSGGRVVLQWQHDTSQPIGIAEASEEAGGLFTKAKISETTLGKDAAILVKDRVIQKMSIGYVTLDAEESKDGIRTLKEVDLMEISLVTHPMNERAVITAVKSLDARELERVLREAGLSKSQAACVAAAGIRSLREAEGKSKEAEELKNLLALTQTLIQSVKGN
jgi:HK97 family phage prohead protease